MEYSYEVVMTDPVARCMEVVYSSTGHTPLHIGVKLPLANETTEQVIAAAAPLAYWAAQDAIVQNPTVGTNGTIVTGSYTPTSAQLTAKFTSLIQQRLDTFARSRNYDGILSACTYMASSNATFHAEAQTCVNLRDATWAAAYVILGEVQAGTRPMPSVMSDIESELPPLVW